MWGGRRVGCDSNPTAVGISVGLIGTDASDSDAVTRHFARFGGSPSTSANNRTLVGMCRDLR
jgi:hypothetical protein